MKIRDKQRRSARGQVLGAAFAFLIVMYSLAVWFIVSNLCAGMYYQLKFDQAAEVAAEVLDLRPTATWNHPEAPLSGDFFSAVGGALGEIFGKMGMSVQVPAPTIVRFNEEQVGIRFFGTYELLGQSLAPSLGVMSGTGMAPEHSQVGFLIVPATNSSDTAKTVMSEPAYNVWLPIVKAPPPGRGVPYGSWYLQSTPQSFMTSLGQRVPAAAFATEARKVWLGANSPAPNPKETVSPGTMDPR